MTVLTTRSSGRCSGLTEATSTLSSMTAEAIPQPEAVCDAPAGIGKAELREGDAFDLIGKLQPESIDLIITSPPYWRGFAPTVWITMRASWPGGKDRATSRFHPHHTNGIVSTAVS